MSSFNARDYYYHRIEVSDDQKYKYVGVLKLRTDPEQEHNVYFGDLNKDHVKDKTGLNAYPSRSKGRKIDKDSFKDDFVLFANSISDKGKDLNYSKMWFEKRMLY